MQIHDAYLQAIGDLELKVLLEPDINYTQPTSTSSRARLGCCSLPSSPCWILSALCEIWKIHLPSGILILIMPMKSKIQSRNLRPRTRLFRGSEDKVLYITESFDRMKNLCTNMIDLISIPSPHRRTSLSNSWHMLLLSSYRCHSWRPISRYHL